jgi:hypothetical protein
MVLAPRDLLDGDAGQSVGDRAVAPANIAIVAHMTSSYFCMIDCLCYSRRRTTSPLDGSCQS